MKPMLAKDADLDKVRWPMLGQPKLDGIRCLIAPAGSTAGVPVSRTLKPIPNREIQDALSRPDLVGLDGELIVGDPTAQDCYRRTSSFVMAANKTDEPWMFMAFDFWNSDADATQRTGAVTDLATKLSWTSLPIFNVETRLLTSRADLDQFEADLLAAGHEGVILRDPAGLYKFGRSGKTGPLLKVKQFIDFEAEVIGVYEEQHNANEAKTNALGRTERSSHAAGKVGKGTLGGLVLRAINGPAEGIEFRCGTGFDADQRVALWHEVRGPEGTLNGVPVGPRCVAKIKSFPIGVKDKPRHPVFLGWRSMELDG